MGVQFEGFDEFVAKLEKIDSSGTKLNQFVSQEAENLIGHTKDNTPVDTGQLRNGWKRTQAAKGRVTVYNNTEYAAHVEYGHRTRGGKGFVKGSKMLHRGMLQTGKHFQEDAAEIMKGLIDE